MENKNDWLEKLVNPSESAAGRRLALKPLFNELSPILYAFFLKQHESPELAREVVQETFDRLSRRLDRPLTRADSVASVKGYVWQTARNVRNDSLKEINQPIDSLEDTPPKDSLHHGALGFEETLTGDWYPRRVRNLVQHLPYDQDRFIMALRLCGLSKNQISRLTPWSVDTVRKRVKASERLLGYEFFRAPEYRQEPSKQEQMLSAAGGPGHEGMTLANTRIDLDYLSSETSRMLCKNLGLKEIQQLPVFFTPILAILNAFSGYPILRLNFSPRDDFNHSVFRGAPVFYLDTIPTFRREKIPGNGKRERLCLDSAFEFRAWLDDYPKTQGGVRVASWYYALPEPMVITKEEEESLQFLDKRAAAKPVLFPFLARSAT